MTKTRKTAAARPDSAPASSLPRTLDPGEAFRFNAVLFRNGSESQAHGFERAARMGQDHLAFLSRRLDRERALMAELAAAQGPADLSGAWAAFMQEAQRDYAEQAQSLMGQWLDGARAVADDAQARVAEAREEAAQPPAAESAPAETLAAETRAAAE